MYPVLLPDAAGAYFCDHYDEARRAWQASTNLARRKYSTACRVERFVHQARGPESEELACELLYLDQSRVERHIVFISATHGIEGYAGSAIQRFLLHSLVQGNLTSPKETGIVFIHALNPWGMAWARRCDDQGIDVNRNFIDFNQPLPGNPNYGRVRSWLHEADKELRSKGLDAVAKELGQVEFDKAISSGQYSDAGGPFYGGMAPCFSNRVIEEVISRYGLAEKPMVVIDLHTGLGPWGYGELICDHPADSKNEHFARRLFGPAVAVTAKGASFSVPKSGLLDYRWHQVMSDNSCFLTLEFGSYNTDHLFDVIIEDHQLWYKQQQHHQPASTMTQQRQRMFEHFCPGDIYWRHSVLVKSWQVAHRLLQLWP